MPGTDIQRRVFREAFRSRFGEAFQTWFVELARHLHPPGQFQAIRNTSGDGGLDGFVIGSDLVYQVYAPARIAELRDSETAAKVRHDFRAAYETLGGRVGAWRFVHNHPEAAVGKLTASAISELAAAHSAVAFRILDIDSLWDELNTLPGEVLARLFPAEEPPETTEEKEDPIPEELTEALKEGRKLLGKARYAEALALFEDVRVSAQESRCRPAEIEARIEIADSQILQSRNIETSRNDVLACLREVGDKGGKTKRMALCVVADAETLLGNVAEAKSQFTEALSLARSQKDRFGEGLVLMGLARAEELLGNIAAAHQCVDAAIEIYRAEQRSKKEDDRLSAAANLAAGLSTKAVMLRREGRVPEALVLLEQARDLFIESESTDNLGRTRLLRAEIMFSGARWQEGYSELGQALRNFEEVGNVSWQCRCLSRLARVFMTFDRKAEALSALKEAIERAQDEGDTEVVPLLLDLAEASRDLKDAEAAEHCVSSATALVSAAGNDSLIADCLLTQARSVDGEDFPTTRKRNDLFRRAAGHLENALAQTEVRGRRAEHMQRLGEISGWMKELGTARRWLERALGEFLAVGDVRGQAHCLEALSEAYHLEKAPDEALAILERLLDLSRTHDIPYYRAIALYNLSELVLTKGDPGRSRRLLNEAKEIATKHDFKNALDRIEPALEHLNVVEQFKRPSDRDLPTLILGLHEWCGHFPSKREAILPLWYHAHRAELWSICRSLLGVKFLIHGTDWNWLRAAAAVVRSGADLTVFGLHFQFEHKGEAEMIPWSPSLVIPATMWFAGVPKDQNPSPAALWRALVKGLRDRPYILSPMAEGKEFPGARLFAVARHLRLPEPIASFMLNTPVEDLSP